MSIALPTPTPLPTAASPPGPAGVWARWRSRLWTLDVALGLGLLLITAGLYARTAGYGFINYDDGLYFAKNGNLTLGLSWAGLRWAFATRFPNWCPVPSLCYLALARCFGIAPGPPHVFNALVHAVNAALLFVFWRRVTGLRWAALAAAALWAWHPLRVESVAWVAETKDVLSCLFLIVALLFYASYARRGSGWAYGGVTAAFLLALASKPTVVPLPAALLLLDFWPLKRIPSWASAGRRVVEKLPWFALAVVIARLTVSEQGDLGALRMNGSFPLTVRLANAVTAYAAYLGRTFWPARLALFYPFPNTLGYSIPARQWGAATALLVGVSLIVLWLWRRYPALGVGWFWFLGMTVPMIGLVQAGLQARADRYTLIPAIGLTAGVVFTAAQWGRRGGNRGSGRRWTALAIVAVVLAAAELGASSVQIGYWRNNLTVFRHANEVTAHNYLAESELSLEYAGDPATRGEALRLARESVADCPRVVHGYAALAAVHQASGDYSKALAAYTACTELEPAFAVHWANRAAVEVELNRYAAAEADFRRAIQVDAADFSARNSLAICLAHDGQIDAAIEQWEQIVRKLPQMGEAQGWLGDALRLRGDRDGAVAHYRAAVADGERRPAWEYNLAWLVATDPRSDAAEIEQVVGPAQDAVKQLHDRDPLALDALAASYARAGQFDEATRVARQAAGVAERGGQRQLAGAIARRGALYAQGQAFVVSH